MEIDYCTDEDLGVCIADEECMKMEKMINNIGCFLIIAPIIVGYLILLMVK